MCVYSPVAALIDGWPHYLLCCGGDTLSVFSHIVFIEDIHIIRILVYYLYVEFQHNNENPGNSRNACKCVVLICSLL